MKVQAKSLQGAALALVLVIGACGNNGGAAETSTSSTLPPTSTSTTAAPATTTVTEPPERLVVWADADRVAPLTEIGARFTADTGLGVEVVEKDFAAIQNDAIRDIVAGSGPDVFVGSHEWTGALVEADVVTRQDDLPSATETDFFRNAFAGFIVAGSSYGLPYQFEAIALWMNTTLAGRSDGPPTFEAVRDVCDRVVDEQREQVCIAVPGGAEAGDAYHQFPFTSVLGGSIFSFDPSFGYVADDAGIDSPESIAGNTVLEALTVEGYVPSFSYRDSEAAFAEGRAVYWMTGPWAAPIVAAGAADSGFEYTVVPLPGIDDNLARPFTEARGFFISNGSTLEEAAKTFLYEYVASETGMAAVYSAGSPLPTHRAVAAGIDDPLLTVFIASAATGQPTPNLPAMTPSIWETWGEALGKIRDQAASADTALRVGAAAINVELDR
jgi:arabinogalactan oligomer/maltooligosaccharide transport system substrate-binding protein